MSRPLMVSSGSNILHRRGSNQSKRSSVQKLNASANSSQQSLNKSHSPSKGKSRKETMIATIEARENHGSISDENEMLQATVSFLPVLDAFDNYLADHCAVEAAESLYAGAIEQSVGESIDGQDYYSESSYELHEVER